MLAIRTILHPTDFSETAGHAFRLACALARDHGSRLIVLHVAVPPMVLYGEGLMALPPPPDLNAIREKLRQWEAPGIRLEPAVVEGDPAAEIQRLAAETPCDLIVLGTHGRKGLLRLLMGSVAEQVVRHAACPVLTVRASLAAPILAGETARELAGAPAGR
jgi:nucleotide-binding universal stress UspA family protein